MGRSPPGGGGQTSTQIGLARLSGPRLQESWPPPQVFARAPTSGSLGPSFRRPSYRSVACLPPGTPVCGFAVRCADMARPRRVCRAPLNQRRSASEVLRLDFSASSAALAGARRMAGEGVSGGGALQRGVPAEFDQRCWQMSAGVGPNFAPDSDDVGGPSRLSSARFRPIRRHLCASTMPWAWRRGSAQQMPIKKVAFCGLLSSPRWRIRPKVRRQAARHGTRA